MDKDNIQEVKIINQAGCANKYCKVCYPYGKYKPKKNLTIKTNNL